MIIQIVLGALILLRIGWLCLRAVTGRGRQSRLDWLLAAGEAVLLMIIARLLLNWSLIPTLWWMVPVVILAAAAVLVSRRWPGLPWTDTGHRRSVSIGGAVVEAVVIVGCVALLLV